MFRAVLGLALLIVTGFLAGASVSCGSASGAREPTPSIRALTGAPAAQAGAAPTAASISTASTATSLPAVTDQAITRGNPRLAEVALVFNVGAGSTPALSVLTTLKEAHTPATFMVMGWMARDHPDVVRAIASAGFAIGSHGDQVADLTQASDAEVQEDLQTADRLIQPLTGRSTRPIWSPSAGYQNARVRRDAAEIGYDTFLWSIDAGDWRTDATAASVEAAVIPHLTDGSIVVLHFDSPKSTEATVAALPALLSALAQRHLVPVTLTTLLEHEPATPPSGEPAQPSG